MFKTGFQKLEKQFCRQKNKEEKEQKAFLTACMEEAKERIDRGENQGPQTLFFSLLLAITLFTSNFVLRTLFNKNIFCVFFLINFFFVKLNLRFTAEPTIRLPTELFHGNSSSQPTRWFATGRRRRKRNRNSPPRPVGRVRHYRPWRPPRPPERALRPYWPSA